MATTSLMTEFGMWVIEEGMEVYDDLTGKAVTIRSLRGKRGTDPVADGEVIFSSQFIYVNDDYLNGERHPWEISPLKN